LALYGMLSEIYSFIFLETEKSKIAVLQPKVQTHVDNLLHHIKAHIGFASRLSFVETVSSFFFDTKKTESEQHEIVGRLREIGRSSELANMILAIMVGSTVELSLGLINMVNLYLGSDHEQQIQSLATTGDLNGYAHEAQRLDPPFQGIYRIALEEVTIADKKFNKDDRVFLDIGAASLNGDVYSDPTTIDPTRKPAAGYLYGDGSFRYLGEAFSIKIMAEVLRAVFGYKNIARAPGQSGVLKRFQEESRPELRFAYLGADMFTSPWPMSMAIQYDAPASS